MAKPFKSELKRARQSEVRRQRNKSFLRTVKTSMKKVLHSIEHKDQEEAKLKLRDATSLLDKGVTKGVLKRNHARRHISRLTLRVNRISAPPA